METIRMKNQMEKNMENEMETGISWGYITHIVLVYPLYSNVVPVLRSTMYRDPH